MNWATSRLIHFDRVASCWLIIRFVDPGAHFIFVDPEGERPAGATSFGFPNSDIGSHTEGTTFSKLITHFKLKEPAIEEVQKIVAAGVAYVMAGREPDPGDRLAWIAVGLLAIAEGMLVMENDDNDILALSLPVWDAIYVETGIQLLRRSPPYAASDSVVRQNSKFVAAVARYRHAIGRARNQANTAD